MASETNETREKSLNFLEEIIEESIAKGETRVQTRFPPEPNGYLHICHAKSICINYGLAKKYGGKCNLRFDDTNPVKEDVEYVDSIKRDIQWLGFDWAVERYASDYFDQLYDWAIVLIKKGLAYVDDQTQEQIRENRGTVSVPGTPSPWRDRSVEENLDLFVRMKNGEFPDGAKVLRAKIDMAHPNMLFRDPIMYRIIHAEHHRTGTKWCIYPMYDYAHGQSDSIEQITHSICTLEFEDQRAFYDWALERVVTVLRTPQLEEAKALIAKMAAGDDDRALAFARAAFHAREKLGQSAPEAAMAEVFDQWQTTEGPETLADQAGQTVFLLLTQHAEHFTPLLQAALSAVVR